MAFYCNGKQGICDCDILCQDCSFYDDSGGKMVQTNGERIRAMSDEALAKNIAENVLTGACNDFINIPGKNPCPHRCEECVLEWLKQPVEVEGKE